MQRHMNRQSERDKAYSRLLELKRLLQRRKLLQKHLIDFIRKKNRQLQRERERRIAQRQNESAQSSRARAHTLSMETSMRQKAMEDRKLVMMAAEEERKQRILDERRQSNREATRRFRQATERCKLGPGAERALTSLPPAILPNSVLTAENPGTANPIAYPIDDWGPSLMSARSSSARRMLSKKDSEIFRTSSKIEFPPLNPKKSLTSNDGAVPIRRPNDLSGGDSGLARAHSLSSINKLASRDGDQSASRPLTRSTSLKQLFQPTPPPCPLPPTAVPIGPGHNRNYSERARLAFRNRTKKISSSSSSLYSSSGSLHSSSASLDTVSLESSSSDDKRARFTLNHREGQRLNKIKTGPQIPSIIKQHKSESPQPKAPHMMPAKDDDSWDSLSDQDSDSGKNNKDTALGGSALNPASGPFYGGASSSRTGLDNTMRRKGGSTTDIRSGASASSAFGTSSYSETFKKRDQEGNEHVTKKFLPKWRQINIGCDEDDSVQEGDTTDSFDSQKASFSEEEMDIDKEQPHTPDKIMFDRPWKIVAEKEVDEFQNAERLDVKVSGEGLSDLDKLKFESLKLTSSASDSSSSESPNKDLDKSVPLPPLIKPVGILKKPRKNRLSKKKGGCSFYIDSFKAGRSNDSGKSKGAKSAKKVTFNDVVQSTLIEYVEPPPDNPPVQECPREEQPAKHNWSASSTNAGGYEEAKATSKTIGDDQNHGNTNKRREDDEVVREKPSEKPTVEVESEETDMEQILSDMDKFHMSEERSLPKLRLKKCQNFDQDDTTGIQPPVCIDSHAPPQSFGQAQVMDQYATEMAGMHGESEEIKIMPESRAISGKCRFISKIPAPPKKSKLRRQVALEQSHQEPQQHKELQHAQELHQQARQLQKSESTNESQQYIEPPQSPMQLQQSREPQQKEETQQAVESQQAEQLLQSEPQNPQAILPQETKRPQQTRKLKQPRQSQRTKVPLPPRQRQQLPRQVHQNKAPQQPLRKPQHAKMLQQTREAHQVNEQQIKLPQPIQQPSSAKMLLPVKPNLPEKLPSIIQPSPANQNPSDVAPYGGASARSRSETDLSLEEQKIKESIDRIDEDFKGYPGSASLIGARGCTSTYHVSLPKPNPPKPPSTYFSQHKRMNYGRELYDPNLEDDYF